MENRTSDDFQLMLTRAGVNPTEQEIERLKAMYEHYVERLKALHESGIAREQPATVSTPRQRARRRG